MPLDVLHCLLSIPIGLLIVRYDGRIAVLRICIDRGTGYLLPLTPRRSSNTAPTQQTETQFMPDSARSPTNPWGKWPLTYSKFPCGSTSRSNQDHETSMAAGEQSEANRFGEGISHESDRGVFPLARRAGKEQEAQ